LLNVPTGHCVTVAEPSHLDPAAHGLQLVLVALVDPPLVKLPAPQTLHVVAPAAE